VLLVTDVGVTAYNGAIALIKDPKVLAAAAGIASVEAYHAGTVRQYLHSIKDTVLAPYTFTVRTTSCTSCYVLAVLLFHSGTAATWCYVAAVPMQYQCSTAAALLLARLHSVCVIHSLC
jgi:Ferritin-like domain